MQHLQDNKKNYYTHKQTAFKKGLEERLKRITNLVDSLEQNPEAAQALSSIANDMTKEIEGHFDIVEIIGRTEHSHRNQEYLTIKFIKKNLTIEVEAEIFDRFYCLARY
jgi:vacuolar-type H+-ATPase subunit I/STV1